MVYNTGETPEELKAKYNPEGSLLRQAQSRMLEMLHFLNGVCKENNIKFCLEAGNVLGSVRHGGFIPWDDDVDVIMERKDYNRFIECMKKVHHPQFVLQTRQTDDGYYGTWVVLRDLKSEYIQDTVIHNLRRYRGLQIDIFPIQRGPIGLLCTLSRLAIGFQNKYLLGHNRLLVGTYSILMNDVLFPVFRMLSSAFGDKRYFTYEYGHYHFPKFAYSDVFPTTDLVFEGETVPGPCHIDNYLRSLYGDYMKLPPVNKRSWHHAKYRIWE